MQIAMEHPVAGPIALVASPMKLSATPVEYRQPPPLLGEHTDAVLASTLGLAPDALRGILAKLTRGGWTETADRAKVG